VSALIPPIHAGQVNGVTLRFLKGRLCESDRAPEIGPFLSGTRLARHPGATPERIMLRFNIPDLQVREFLHGAETGPAFKMSDVVLLLPMPAS
jgi:hypothetical protein